MHSRLKLRQSQAPYWLNLTTRDMTRKGLLSAGLAYFSWGLFPLYFKQIQSIPAFEILLNRMIWCLLFLCLVLSWRSQWGWLAVSFKRPKVLLGFALSAVLLSANWFVYIWAVNHDHVIDASLGYFITPLVNILIGFVVLRERLRQLQWLAVALAAAGVVWLGWQTGHIPWVGVILALSFGIYGLLRKTASLGALEGLSLETMLLFPFALGYWLWLSLQHSNHFFLADWSIQSLLILAGPITAIPLLLFAAGARQISMSSLGLLQYISPMTQFFLGVWLYHEAFDSQRLLGFVLIWSALLLYSGESLYRNWRTTTA